MKKSYQSPLQFATAAIFTATLSVGLAGCNDSAVEPETVDNDPEVHILEPTDGYDTSVDDDPVADNSYDNNPYNNDTSTTRQTAKPVYEPEPTTESKSDNNPGLKLSPSYDKPTPNANRASSDDSSNENARQGDNTIENEDVKEISTDN